MSEPMPPFNATLSKIGRIIYANGPIINMLPLLFVGWVFWYIWEYFPVIGDNNSFFTIRVTLIFFFVGMLAQGIFHFKTTETADKQQGVWWSFPLKLIIFSIFTIFPTITLLGDLKPSIFPIFNNYKISEVQIIGAGGIYFSILILTVASSISPRKWLNSIATFASLFWASTGAISLLAKMHFYPDFEAIYQNSSIAHLRTLALIIIGIVSSILILDSSLKSFTPLNVKRRSIKYTDIQMDRNPSIQETLADSLAELINALAYLWQPLELILVNFKVLFLIIIEELCKYIIFNILSLNTIKSIFCMMLIYVQYLIIYNIKLISNSIYFYQNNHDVDNMFKIIYSFALFLLLLFATKVLIFFIFSKNAETQKSLELKSTLHPETQASEKTSISIGESIRVIFSNILIQLLLILIVYMVESWLYLWIKGGTVHPFLLMVSVGLIVAVLIIWASSQRKERPKTDKRQEIVYELISLKPQSIIVSLVYTAITIYLIYKIDSNTKFLNIKYIIIILFAMISLYYLNIKININKTNFHKILIFIISIISIISIFFIYINNDKKIVYSKNTEIEYNKKYDSLSFKYKVTLNEIYNNMICIDGGEFLFGDDKDIKYVNSFLLSKVEVTQRQYETLCNKNPSTFNQCGNCPVEQISWNDTQAFIKKLNEVTGLKYRLPTEIEWEYAARERGKDRRFGNGEDIANPEKINFEASKKYKEIYSMVGIYRKKTLPVNFSSPNSLGLFNMSGNVYEWCQDLYIEYPLQNNTRYNSSKNYLKNVIRGGSWYSPPSNCRTTYRTGYISTDHADNIGFRLCLSTE